MEKTPASQKRVNREGGPLSAAMLKSSVNLAPLHEEGFARFRHWANEFRTNNPNAFSGEGGKVAERLISMVNGESDVFCANRAKVALEKLAEENNLDYAEFECRLLENWKARRMTHFAREELTASLERFSPEEEMTVELIFKRAMGYANEERAPTEDETKRLIIALWMLRGALEQKKNGKDALVFLKNMTYVYECL